MLKASWALLFALLNRKKIISMNIKNYTSFVMPWDLDLNMHVNNAKYLSFCNRARLYFLGRSGLVHIVLKSKLKPVITDSEIKYLKPLKILDKYSIDTKISEIEKLKIRIRHTIYNNQKKIALVNTTMMFVNSSGRPCSHPFLGFNTEEWLKKL